MHEGKIPFNEREKDFYELALKISGAPFPWDMMEGVKGVQLAEIGLDSWGKRCWVNVPDVR